jgi:hypothetical protein
LASPVPEVVVDLAVLVQPEVAAGLERLPQPSLLTQLPLLPLVAVLSLPAGLLQLPVLAHLPVLAQVALRALLEAEAERAVEAVSVEALHHRQSLSSAMAENLPSTGTPRYSPVPRSGRKAKRHP